MNARSSNRKLAGVLKAACKTALAVVLTVSMMPSVAFVGDAQGLAFAATEISANDTTPSSDAPQSDVTLMAKSFPDVAEGAWYHDSVIRSVDKGLVSGYDSGLFGPADTLTRGQAATILWRYYEPTEANAYVASSAGNTTGLADVQAGQFYTGAANWAVSQGVISGKEQPDGSRLFDPEGAITREQLCAIIANAASMFTGCAVEGGEAKLASMPDAAGVSSWAAASVGWGLANGVISGTETNGTRYISPSQSVNRATMAAVIINALDNSLLGVSHKPTVNPNAENYITLDSSGNIDTLHAEGVATKASSIECADGVTLKQGVALQDVSGTWDTGSLNFDVKIGEHVHVGLNLNLSNDYKLDISLGQVNEFYFAPKLKSTFTGSITGKEKLEKDLCKIVYPTKIPGINLELSLKAVVSASGTLEVSYSTTCGGWVHYGSGEGWTCGTSFEKTVNASMKADLKMGIGAEVGVMFVTEKIAYAGVNGGAKFSLQNTQVRNATLTCADLGIKPYFGFDAGIGALTFSRDFDLNDKIAATLHLENWAIVGKCTWAADDNPDNPARVGAVTNLTVALTDNGAWHNPPSTGITLTASWNPAANADGYEVQWFRRMGANDYRGGGIVKTTECSDSATGSGTLANGKVVVTPYRKTASGSLQYGSSTSYVYSL